MKKFIFTVTSLNLDYQLAKMPAVGILNIVFHDLGINTKGLYFSEEKLQEFQGRHLPPSETLEKLLELLERYEETIESLELRNFHVDSGKTFLEILKKMKNLKELKISSGVMFAYDPNDIPEDLPMIESALLTDSSEIYFDFLKNFKNLKKFKFIKDDQSSGNFNFSKLNELLVAVPSIKHLILEGSSTRGFFSQQIDNLPFRLETIEADGINLSRHDGQPRLAFLESQLGSLKDLRVKKLPYDNDGDQVLNFIIEVMNVQKFYYDGKAFIENGEKVKGIKEIWFNENTIKAGMELVKQFPGEKS